MELFDLKEKFKNAELKEFEIRGIFDLDSKNKALKNIKR